MSAPRTGHIELPHGDGGTTTVFYPTEATDTPVQTGPFQLCWAEDAQPRRGNGRLVVIPQGSGGSPWVHIDLARVLVARGFTVALPQHAGVKVHDPSEPGPTSWSRRPIQVSQAIDRVAADGWLAPLPPLEPGSVAERLPGDPPSFNRAAARPPMHAAIAECFVQGLGPAR